MAGLFGMDTPEEIRARIGKTDNEQGMNLAQLPAGRVGVATNYNLGAGATRGAAQLLGAPTEVSKADEKKKMLAQQIKTKLETSHKGMSIEQIKQEKPDEYLNTVAMTLLENGETQAATNALAMLKMRVQMKNAASAAREAEAKMTAALAGGTPTKPNQTKVTSKDIEMAVPEVTARLKAGGREINDDAQVYSLAKSFAELKQHILDYNKSTKGNAPMSSSEAENWAWNKLIGKIKDEGDGWLTDWGLKDSTYDPYSVSSPEDIPSIDMR